MTHGNDIIIVLNDDIFFTVCKILNDTTGMMSECDIDCCEDDYCNAAGRISGLVACLLAVLLALFLN